MAGGKRKGKGVKKPRRPVVAPVPPPTRLDAAQPSAFTDWKALSACMALIVMAGVLAYANTFKAPFVFDDLPNIYTNEAIRSISGVMSGWDEVRFVGFLTFAINYKLHGLGVTGYHVFNLAVHLVSALLVFWLALLTLKTPFFRESRLGRPGLLPLGIALFAGLIFAVHPVQTQSVTYIVQRLASLATLFYLLSLVLYALWRLRADNHQAVNPPGRAPFFDLKKKRVFLYIASLVSALLAMSTKEIAFTLPIVIALWEFAFFSGDARRRLISLLPFAFTLAVIPLSLLIDDETMMSRTGFGEPPSSTDYFFTQIRVIVTYLRLLVFPAGQNLDYDYPVYHTPFEPAVLMSAGLLLALAGLGVILWRRAAKNSGLALLRLISFGIFWFFITISVESSFISISDVIFEHRLYLPSVGLIIAVVAGGAFLASVLRPKIPHISRVVVPLAVVVVVALGAAAFSRNQVWGDPISLWEDVTRKSPGKARPHQVLGYYYYQAGKAELAEAENLKAVAIKPAYADALNSLGVIYLDSGRLDQAESTLQQALDASPDFAEAHFNLGTVYWKSGQNDKAEAELKLAVKANPGYTKAWQNLAMIYITEERLEEAIGPLMRVIELDPDDYLAHNDLGNIYAMQGRYNEAKVKYRKALSINPDFQEARDNLTMLQGATN